MFARFSEYKRNLQQNASRANVKAIIDLLKNLNVVQYQSRRRGCLFFPNQAGNFQFGLCDFLVLATCYKFSRTFHLLNVFPRLPLVMCFPALSRPC